MAEDIDFSKAIDELKNMLSSDEGESQIQNILGMLANQDEQKNRDRVSDEDQKNADGGLLGDLDIESILKIKNILSAAESGKNDSGAAFLCALKPFLSENRQKKLENASKILNMTKAFKMLKDLGIGGV